MQHHCILRFEIMVLEKDFTYNDVNYRAWSDGKIMGLGRGKYLKTRINKDGYEEVTLGSTQKRSAGVKVHRIIAELFVPNDDPENKVEVNHKDFNRLNNDYTNLEWITHKENVAYSVKHGNYNKGQHAGELNGRSRLTKNDVKEIRELIKNGWKTADIANRYNVGWSTIYHIKIGDTWKGVS